MTAAQRRLTTAAVVTIATSILAAGWSTDWLANDLRGLAIGAPVGCATWIALTVCAWGRWIKP